MRPGEAAWKARVWIGGSWQDLKDALWRWALDTLQRRCRHPSYAINADVLEGEVHVGPDSTHWQEVLWCRICGAYARRWYGGPPYREPRTAGWHGPRALLSRHIVAGPLPLGILRLYHDEAGARQKAETPDGQTLVGAKGYQPWTKTRKP